MVNNRIINFNTQFLNTMGGEVGFIVFGGDPFIGTKIGPYHVSLDFSGAAEHGVYRALVHHNKPMHRTLGKFIFRAIEPVAMNVVNLIRDHGIVALAGFDPGGYPRIVYHDLATGDYFMYLEDEQKIFSVIKE